MKLFTFTSSAPSALPSSKDRCDKPFDAGLMDKLYTVEIMDGWIDVKDKIPTETGQYLCKDESGHEFPAFLSKNGKGKLVWLFPAPNLLISFWCPLKNPRS
jgi:hypothetical protein